MLRNKHAKCNKSNNVTLWKGKLIINKHAECDILSDITYNAYQNKK